MEPFESLELAQTYEHQPEDCGSFVKGLASCRAQTEGLSGIPPRSKGGRFDQPGNKSFACQPCNTDKGSRSLRSWLLRLETVGDRRRKNSQAFWLRRRTAGDYQLCSSRRERAYFRRPDRIGNWDELEAAILHYAAKLKEPVIGRDDVSFLKISVV